MGQYRFRINGRDFDVKVNSIGDTDARVSVNGIDYDIQIDASGAAFPSSAESWGDAAEGNVAPDAAASLNAGAAGAVPPGAASPRLPAAPGGTATAANTAAKAAGKTVCSPLPGVILEVCATQGQNVRRGQRLIVLEAMKMENEIQAEADGIVTSVNVSKGDNVPEGAPLITIR